VGGLAQRVADAPLAGHSPPRPYTELVYQPMLELMAFLRANGFTVYIVSGGGVEFMRTWVAGAVSPSPGRCSSSLVEWAPVCESRDWCYILRTFAHLFPGTPSR
jgi:hypothetical protein